MKNFFKKTMLASASVVALGVVATSNSAQAFDEVNWVWNKDVVEIVNKDVDIYIENMPSGMVEIEKVQTQIGDVTANSVVSGINNNPPGVGGGDTVQFTEIITVTSNFDKPVGVGNNVGDAGGNINDDGDTPLVSTYIEGSLAEQQNGYTVINDIEISGELEVESLQGINSAIDLPEVVSSATAVGNNQTIDSDVSIDLHDAQFLFGGYAEGDQVDNAQLLNEVLSITPNLGNTNTSGAAFTTFASALGLIVPANVTSNSLVNDIQNASVDSDATSVGNNFDVNLDAVTPDDALVIADITQYSFADITSTSTVSGVEVNNYIDFGAAGFGPLGDPQKPLVSSSATSVGNNFAITVSSPTL